MKNSFSNTLRKATKYFLGLAAIGMINACVDDVLPGAGSRPDDVPPGANFSYASDANDFKIISFTNLSSEAIYFEWDFGVKDVEVPDSVTTAKDPVYTYPDEDTYTVTLIATDGLGISDTVTLEVEVVKGPYLPVILEPGFEDGQLDGGTGDGRDAWRSKTWTDDGNSWADENAVFGISASPVTYGSQAAKLEPQPSNPRQGYQEITVEEDQNYDLYFWYTMKDGSDDPWATVSIVGVTDFGPITSKVEAKAGIIASVTIKDDSEPETYVQQKLSFNSGTNTTVAIYFWNDGNVETRLDEFSIEIGSAGAIPPSVSFTSAQSSVNYLEYTFQNTSVDAVSYEWDFGDENTSTDESPTHTYAEAGEYTVSLIATSENGLSADYSTDIVIHDKVTADFTYTVDGSNKFLYMFADASSANTVSVEWDFGDGWSTSVEDPTHTYPQDGFYTVSLTATSVTGYTHTKTETLALGVPTVLNGAFDDGSSNWKISSFTGGNTNPFNASGDGSPLNYDGSTNEAGKTPGAKWTQGTSAGEFTSSTTRYAYQAMDLDPNTDYYLEFAYSIKDDAATEPAGGRRIVGEILDGHFSDGANAVVATRLATHEGTVVAGGKNFTVAQVPFTSNASGEVSIWIWAVTPVDAYADNVKILPAWMVDTP